MLLQEGIKIEFVYSFVGPIGEASIFGLHSENLTYAGLTIADYGLVIQIW